MGIMVKFFFSKKEFFQKQIDKKYYKHDEMDTYEDNKEVDYDNVYTVAEQVLDEQLLQEYFEGYYNENLGVFVPGYNHLDDDFENGVYENTKSNSMSFQCVLQQNKEKQVQGQNSNGHCSFNDVGFGKKNLSATIDLNSTNIKKIHNNDASNQMDLCN